MSSGAAPRATAEPLDAAAIERAFAAGGIAPCPRVEVLQSTPSTNADLLARARAGQDIHAVALFAEQQSAGRGRRGRHWVSPPGGNLYLSFGWRTGRTALEGLSLVAGLAVAAALGEGAGAAVQLKWPNDLLADGRKLGGILVELHFGEDGVASVVIGIGINLALPAAAAADIGQPWTDLATVCGRVPARNALAAALLGQLVTTLTRFEREGFAAFHADWDAHDALRGRPVRVEGGAGAPLEGTAAGVDGDGALRVRSGAILHTVSAGDVSVRAGA